jgi:hypothetical protein
MKIPPPPLSPFGPDYLLRRISGFLHRTVKKSGIAKAVFFYEENR